MSGLISSKRAIIQLDPVAIGVLQINLLDAIRTIRDHSFLSLRTEILHLLLSERRDDLWERGNPQREVDIDVTLGAALRTCDEMQLRVRTQVKPYVLRIFERIRGRLQAENGAVELRTFLQISDMERYVIKFGRLIHWFGK